MKFLKIVSFVAILYWASIVSGEEEGSKRTNLLLRRPNPRNGPLSKTTTTTTVAPKQQEDEGIDEEYDQTEDLDEAEKAQDVTSVSTTTTTTTEPPKKIGPIIRPFRSNDDLLLALKRRQMSIKKNTKVEKTTSKPDLESEKQESASTPQKSTISDKSSSRRRFGGQKQSASDGEDPSNAGDEQTPIKRPSRFSSRSLRSN